jgi:hypothetical protein
VYLHIHRSQASVRAAEVMNAIRRFTPHKTMGPQGPISYAASVDQLIEITCPTKKLLMAPCTMFLVPAIEQVTHISK